MGTSLVFSQFINFILLFLKILIGTLKLSLSHPPGHLGVELSVNTCHSLPSSYCYNLARVAQVARVARVVARKGCRTTNGNLWGAK